MKSSYAGSNPSPRSMETDIVFLALYKPSKEVNQVIKGSDPVTRWESVYGNQEDAYRGAAVFIRDHLLNSTLCTSEKMEAVEAIEDAVRTGDVEAVIAYWNEEVTNHQVRVYKGLAL